LASFFTGKAEENKRQGFQEAHLNYLYFSFIDDDKSEFVGANINE
jgi:hypothetical protein